MKARSASDIGAIVRGRRRDLGLSQAALAQVVGVSRKWVSEFENGKTTAELGLVMRSLDALGLEVGVTDRAEAREGKAGVDLDEIVAEHTDRG